MYLTYHRYAAPFTNRYPAEIGVLTSPALSCRPVGEADGVSHRAGPRLPPTGPAHRLCGEAASRQAQDDRHTVTSAVRALPSRSRSRKREMAGIRQDQRLYRSIGCKLGQFPGIRAARTRTFDRAVKYANNHCCAIL